MPFLLEKNRGPCRLKLCYLGWLNFSYIEQNSDYCTNKKLVEKFLTAIGLKNDFFFFSQFTFSSFYTHFYFLFLFGLFYLSFFHFFSIFLFIFIFFSIFSLYIFFFFFSIFYQFFSNSFLFLFLLDRGHILDFFQIFFSMQGNIRYEN